MSSTGNHIETPIHAQTVTLWHPIDSSTKEVKEWRAILMQEEIQQPFKQAHRELYVVTDAELNTDTYSNRFAGHILRQHIFNALCRERGWQYALQGGWDGDNTPSKKVPAWDMHVEYWLDTNWNEDNMNEFGVFNYVFSDQVRFYDRENQLPMEDVPPIVFSEIMRDVDLFVGVTSIGADPNWQDRGEARFNTYWNDFSFGDLNVSGKERKELLEQLIPKLYIHELCSFEGNFLVVQGKVRTYKIHLGSGNILMKPNDQYLCIVPDRSKKKNQQVFLPFEGDNMLSIIISKAFLLAADNKITDRTIISQISRV